MPSTSVGTDRTGPTAERLVTHADGINSWTREQIHGDKVRPQCTGHMGLRRLLHDAPDVEPGFYNSRHTTVILGLLRGGTV